MKVKVFQSNHNGKIEFTRAELEKLLNEVYTDGYNEGKSSHWTWTSPYVSSTDGITLTNTTNATSINPINSNCADKIEAVLDNSITSSNANTTDYKINEITKKSPSYTVKVNGTDISKLVNDIFGAGAARSKTAEDAFDKLARELNF